MEHGQEFYEPFHTVWRVVMLNCVYDDAMTKTQKESETVSCRATILSGYCLAVAATAGNCDQVNNSEITPNNIMQPVWVSYGLRSRSCL